MTSAFINSEALLQTAVLKPAESPAVEPALWASPSAFEDIGPLYAEFSPRIFRFLHASLRDRDLAETLTQDTFTRAWVARAQFRGECSVGTWLMRLALNLLRDHTRTNRFRFWKQAAVSAVDAHDVGTQLPSHSRSSEAALIAHQRLQQVWETVAGLSQRQQTVFLLRFVEELELDEIASVTGMPLSTVKTHLYRGLALIRARHALQNGPGAMPAGCRTATPASSRNATKEPR